jgi:hypothetical protein
MRVTPSRSNMYQGVSLQPTDPPIHSDMSIAASTVIETFQSDIDDVKGGVQELNKGMQTTTAHFTNSNSKNNSQH